MKKVIIIISILFATLATGCKPTERNYQEAYEAAIRKKQIESEDKDLNIPGGKLESLDGPKQRDIGGDNFNIEAGWLKYIGDDEIFRISRYNVAVARYKMRVNCEAQIEDLKKEGYKSYILENREGYYFAVICGTDTLDEAAQAAKKYMTGKQGGVFVGLEGAPLILEKR